MKIGTYDIEKILYAQLKDAGFKGGVRHGKFVKDTAKLIYELLEGEEMNKLWNMAHDFPVELERTVKRFEKELDMLLPRTKEAEPIYLWVLEQEKTGRKFEQFAKWANSPDRIQYKTKYFHKPHYIQVDYSTAFAPPASTDKRTSLLETIT
jgi:hypothetical protein